MNTKAVSTLVVCGIILIALLYGASNVIHIVSPKDIVVYQSLMGNMDVWIEPGPKLQLFGSVTTYHKSTQYWFSKFEDQGQSKDQSVGVKFNDGGHAQISGSLRYDLPLDKVTIFKIHQTYGSQAAIDQQLIRTVVEKSVYFTGPLMSSKESYAERRSELISDIEGQAKEGIWKTKTEDVEQTDLISGQKKMVTVTKISKGESGKAEVREKSPIEDFSITISNFTINDVTYSEIVEKQIAQQQESLMSIQTSLAAAKKAVQDAITVESQGRANAAKAKWEQEVEKAKFVTQAEQNKAVAKLVADQEKEVALVKAQQEKDVALVKAQREKDVAKLDAEKRMQVAELGKKAADFTRSEQILLGEGNAKRRELELNADGALGLRLDAWKEVMGKAYENLGKQSWVPVISMGGASPGGQGAGALQNMIELLSVKAAKDLGLELGISTSTAHKAVAATPVVTQ
ncbi:MAG: hypothetical protein HY226_00405 [Candidatus Vogelbacteria bacterium]|nr:hypothetical protein [Candidatus Vogelbacteria bacterium]